MIGKTLGHYRVVQELGRGGMGEVYLADDISLDRKVALKFLPDAFTGDPERMARFEREAKLLASLNHPNIAAIYGLEQAEGKRFIVMELVEGETLAQRISKGPLPIERALGVCRQIAEGLEAAHEKGVIHRDLKPANVMITAGDKVKILDFGLAKALSDEAQSVDSSQSPTLTEAMTRPGGILGTAAYMSPEQTKGKAVDKRADIWAFGCILYECLTGKRVFESETISETLAAILRGEPDWDALPEAVAPNVRLALRRCLDKDLNRRLHDAADVRIEIEAARSEPVSIAGTPAGFISRRRAFFLTAGALLLGAAIVSIASWYGKQPIRGTPVHLSVTLPHGDIISKANLPVAFSPDGKHLAYISNGNGRWPQLYIRALDNPQARVIPGTDGASAPFFSPDGLWIGFFAHTKLLKVSIAGGAAMAICNAGYSAGASWGADDTIVFSPSVSSGLFVVSASGGTPKTLTTLDAAKGEISHRYPQFLPGSKAVLFTVVTGFGWDNQHIDLLRIKSGERRTIIQGGHTGRVVPTGQLIYSRAGALLALPFDLDRQEVTSSTPVTIAEEIRQSETIAAEYAFSETGSLAYIPSGPQAFEQRLTWVDRDGKLESLAAPLKDYVNAALSPNGRQIAVEISSNTVNLYIYDVERENLTPLTSEGSSQVPVWSPDGKRVAYRATRGGFRNIFWRAADGTGAEERLTVGPNQQTPGSWSPDGKTLAFTEVSPETGNDIWILYLEAKDNRNSRPFIRTPFQEWSPAFSPDGCWLAYTSDKSGRSEVYVQPFPGPGREWQVSTQGGTGTLWAKAGRELFYVKGSAIWVVDIETKPEFRMGKPRLLYENSMDVFSFSPAGRRFLGVQPVEPGNPSQIHVVLNWFEELRQRVPAEKK